jgi:hypothetical protein
MLEREQTVLMRLGVQEMMNMTFESGIDKVDTAEACAGGRSEEEMCVACSFMDQFMH